MKKISLKKQAFTLAEVLMTLGVIGVIAIMTIPTLTHNYKRIATETHIQKFYTEINQAVKLSEAVNGNKKKWAFEAESDNNGTNIKKFYDRYLAQFLATATVATSSKEEDENGTNGLYITLTNGSGIKITNGGHRYYYCTNASDLPLKEDITLGSKCFIFAFYPNATETKDDKGEVIFSKDAADNYRNKGVEPYVPNDLKISENQNLQDALIDIYKKGGKEGRDIAAKAIQMNGWKTPKRPR